MKLRFCLFTILCILGICSLVPSKIHADAVTPSILEKVIMKDSKTTGKITFKNESAEPVTISPTVSAYDPKTLQLITDEKTIFLMLDIETYTVQPQGNLILNYEIKPPANLVPGTYFNLIILQKTSSQGYINEKNQLDTTAILSQLVVIHILEKQETLPLQLKTDFAQITMEISDAGFPFLKPMSIRYIYQNTTNYVLQPQGEIQVFDSKSSYSPEYRQINTNNKKLYPGDSIEEVLIVNNWHLSDILFGRKIVGRFYNGIDQNSITKELSQNSYYTYLVISALIVVLIIVLIKSVRADKKRKTT